MKEDQYIKESINQIDIPINKLNMIIDQSFEQERKLTKNPLKRGLKYVASTVAISAVVFFTATVSPAFANFVNQIPVIGQAFEHFISKEGYYEAYEKISTDIFSIEESNGVPLAIEQAFYDGNTVILSYIIRTKEQFGEFLVFEQLPSIDAHFDGAGYDVEYVDGLGYVGMIRLNVRGNEKETVTVTWEPKAISSYEGDKRVEGDWKFEFPLDAIETHKVRINKKVSKDLVTVELVDAIKTNVNMSINYIQDIDPALHEQWEAVEAELYAVDNLGNRYEVPYNGGHGIGGDSREDMIWNATIHGLNPEATSITFYPFATLSYYRSENDSDSKRIDFDPITIKMDEFTK